MADIPIKFYKSVVRSQKFNPSNPPDLEDPAPVVNPPGSVPTTLYKLLGDVTDSDFIGKNGFVPVVVGENVLTLQSLTTNVLATPLTGYVVGANTAISASNTILTAFQQVQGQINARVSGTIATSQVAFGTGVNTVGGSGNLLFTGGTLSINGSGVSIPVILSTGYDDSGAVVNRRANGTISSPTALTITQLIGGVLARGYDGTSFTSQSNAGIYIYSSQNWSPTANGTYITLETTLNSTTTRSERIRILDNGNILIGTTIDTSNKLRVDGTVRVDNSNNNFDINPTLTETILRLSRLGKSGVSFSSVVDFGISRFENVGTNARTQIDIRLTNGGTAVPEVTVLSLRSNGNIGIGTTTPTNLLDVNGTARIRTISNGTGDFLTKSATGVITSRTAAEVRTDIGAQASITGTSSHVLFFDGANNPAGDSGLTYVKASKRLLISDTVTPPFPFDLQIDKSSAVNGYVGIGVRNSTSTGESSLALRNNTGYLGVEVFGSAWANVSLRNWALWTLESTLSGLGFATLGSAPIVFRTNAGSGGILNTRLTISSAGLFSYGEGNDFEFGTTTGTKIGTATTQKIAFWNKTPIIQPTTAYASSVLVSLGGTTITDTDTFDGYTLKQIVSALRGIGLLA